MATKNKASKTAKEKSSDKDRMDLSSPMSPTPAITPDAMPMQDTAGGAYGGQSLISQAARNYVIAQRNANLDTLFAFFIDQVSNPSKMLQKDPRAIEHMETDLQVMSCLNLLKLSVSMQKRQWEPSKKDKDGSIASLFEKLFDNMFQPTTFINNMLSSVFRGISFSELVWNYINIDGKRYCYVERAFDVHHDRFVFNKIGQLRFKHRGNVYFGDFVNYSNGKQIIINDPMKETQPADPLQFVYMVYNPVGGSWNDPNMEAQQYWGRGLIENLWPTYYAKTVVLNNMENFMEFLAGGKVVTRYPGNQPNAQSKAVSLGTELVNGASIALPSGLSGQNERTWDLSFMTGPSNPGQIFSEVIRYYDKQIAKLILGTSIVNDSGDTGTQNSPKSQLPVTFGRIVKFISTCFEEFMRRFMVPCYGVANGIDPEMYPEFSFVEPVTSDADAMSKVLFSLNTMGYDISKEMVYEYTGIRIMKDGEEKLESIAFDSPNTVTGQPSRFRKAAKGGSGDKRPEKKEKP